MTIFFYLFLGALTLGGPLTDAQVAAAPDSVFESVEVRLAELSPNGEAGGYAVPASGASKPTISASCDASGNSATLYFNGSQDPHGHWHPLTYQVRIDDSSNAWSPNACSVLYPGDQCFSTTANSYNMAVTPGRSYSWWVHGESGGQWSDAVGGSFTCQPPRPTVDLWADKYVVPYNTGTNLAWTSTNASVCHAGGSWSGNKSISGSGYPTGPLTGPTPYNIYCTHPVNGQSIPDSVTINIKYGEGTETYVRCPSISGKNVTVRKGTECAIEWNTGTSDPANCTLKAGVLVLLATIPTVTGSTDWEATGETTITLDCENGNNTASSLIKILPEFQET